MIEPKIDDLLAAVDSKYSLVILSAKRARQLNRGASVRVDSRHKKPTSLALEEIAAAKVEYRVKDDGETAKG